MRYLIALFAGCSVLLLGCTPIDWQRGAETAGQIIDTAAVVRARQLGLCGAGAKRPLATPEDVMAMQEEIEQLKAELAAAQGELTRIAVERARAARP